ncbi:spore coat protein GerQ [Paenibacillus physcomitrellae]|uniref:spore coat protein GerQ n=1 Tax=Paenibacillus physcomitrellae TaxID=1619311 RepID=UPI00157FAE69
MFNPNYRASYTFGGTQTAMPNQAAGTQAAMPNQMGGTQAAMPMQMGGTGTPPSLSGNQMTQGGAVVVSPTPTYEQSYIENIFRMNLGKLGTFYMTYENNSQWNAKIFQGILEAAGRDHIIISDPKTGQRIVMLMVNFDYATFDQPLNYTYPGVIGNPPTATRRG